MNVILILSILLGLGMVVSATWLVGLWNNILTWISLVISAMVASSFFEPLATRLSNSAPESTYLVDFVAAWGVFVATFVVLRVATEVLSRHRMQFDLWTEMIGRSIMSILIAVTLFAFVSFTLHTAPLPNFGFWGENFQPTPESQSLGIGADRVWMRFLKSASVGSMSEFRDSRLLPPYELPTSTNSREFDPADELIARYQQRRKILSEQNNIQIINANAK